MTRLRLYCLPYAGGSAVRTYAGWRDRLPRIAGGGVEVVPLEQAGRGNRVRERPVPFADAVVADVVRRVLPWRGAPFALFGHSMGAMLAMEAARVLEHRHGLVARALMVSGAGAPGPEAPARAEWLLPEPQFRERIRQLAGTPPEVLESDELMALFLPVLRADFAVAAQLRRRGGRPVTAPITVFGGDRDREVPVASLAGWEAHSTAGCTVEVLPGGHFFLDESAEALVALVGERLQAVATPWRTAARSR